MPDFVQYVFSTIPDDVKNYSREVVDYSGDIVESVERHIESVAASLRQTLQNTPWVPESIKPPPPPRSKVPTVPLTYLERAQNWISRNRAITAAVVAFIGTSTFIIWRRRRISRRKRRARKVANGARTEVVILAGSPHSPLTRSLSLDLERRGFIVYIPVSTMAEEQIVHAELRADIHPLNLDITSPESTAEALAKLSSDLSHPHRRTLHLAALLLLPSHPSTLPTGPISSLPPPLWSDALNTHILYPLSIVHAFFPLLSAQHRSPQGSAPHTSLILIQPSITPSLRPPHHAPESVTASALAAWLQTLRLELSGTNVAVTHLKLGSFDFTSAARGRQQLITQRANRREERRPSGGERAKSSWLESYFSLGATGHGLKGTSLRELHDGVFDAVVGRYSGGTVFLGRGSWAYEMVGRWVPMGIVGWMIGRTDEVRAQEQQDDDGDHLQSLGEGSVEWEDVGKAA